MPAERPKRFSRVREAEIYLQTANQGRGDDSCSYIMHRISTTCGYLWDKYGIILHETRTVADIPSWIHARHPDPVL